VKSISWQQRSDRLLAYLTCWDYTAVYLNTNMRKFESSQKDESRTQSADSSKANRKPKLLKLSIVVVPPWKCENASVILTELISIKSISK